MIIERTPRLAVRTFRMSKPDGTEYWQGRFPCRFKVAPGGMASRSTLIELSKTPSETR